MNPLTIKFRGFSVRSNGKEEYVLIDKTSNKAVTLKGVWLEGSLIKLYDKSIPSYYIHDGYPQKYSGYRYIPVLNEVIPDSITFISETSE